MIKDKVSFRVILFLVGIIIFLMNLAIFPFNRILSLINLSITTILVIIGYLALRNYENYRLKISDDIKSVIDEGSQNLINYVPSPIVVLSAKNPKNVVFYNECFREIFISKINYTEFIERYGKAFSEVINKNEGYIFFNGRNFRIFTKKSKDFIVLYFTDDTEFRTLKKRYNDNRPCVGFVVFDNRDELYRYATDEENSQILVSVESILRNWIVKYEGIFKKLSNGKYFIVFQEKYLKKFISEKFKIIDKIHTAKIDEHRYATVSIGISRGGENLCEAKNEAAHALDMSLGRGGDQVAVKGKNSYEFFGGTSRGLEKRSKVRTRVVASMLSERISSSDIVFIMGHKYSDFDSVGACAGLWSICKKEKNKNSFIVINKKESMAFSAIEHIESLNSEKIFISPYQAQAMMTDKSLLIIVDTHSLNFIENSDLYFSFKNIAVIDHHRLTVNKIENAVIFYHEPSASSTCEMVTELIEYIGDKYLNKVESECLLAGIALDTKNFTIKAGVRTFEAAAYLRKKGADMSEVKQMFAGPIENYRLKCKIIESTRIVENCAVAHLKEINKNSRMCCAQAADELLNVKNIKASFVLFTDGEKINISARSLGNINVQTVMESLGGGGHQNMAAAQVEGMNIEQVEQKLVEIIKSNNIEKNGE